MNLLAACSSGWLRQLITLFMLTNAACAASAQVVAQEEQAWESWKSAYDADVLPIIAAKCNSCHNEETAEGELNLAKYSLVSSASLGSSYGIAILWTAPLTFGQLWSAVEHVMAPSKKVSGTIIC